MSAQNPKKYIPSPALDKFVGTWVYNENGKKVVIILKKVKVDLNDIFTDMLVGYDIFTFNNKIIEDSKDKNKLSLKLGNNEYDNDVENPNRVSISLYDSIKKKNGNVTLRIFPGKPNEMQ